MDIDVDPEGINSIDGMSFAGEPVLTTSTVIQKAGDGLSDAMEVDPMVLGPHWSGVVVLRVRMSTYRLKPIQRGLESGWNLVHVINAETATFMDSKTAERLLDKTKAKIEQARDERKGRLRLLEDERLEVGDDDADEG